MLSTTGDYAGALDEYYGKSSSGGGMWAAIGAAVAGIAKASKAPGAMPAQMGATRINQGGSTYIAAPNWSGPDTNTGRFIENLPMIGMVAVAGGGVMAGAQVTRLDWCEELAAGVKRAIARDFEAVAANVINGYAQGWRITTDSGRCYVITRIDEFNGRRECVAMAVAGRGALDACALIYNAAIAAGCDRIRFHTENPAVARLVGKRYAVRLDESVFSVAVGDRA